MSSYANISLAITDVPRLSSKLEDWSSGSDNEDPAAPLGGAPQPGNNRMNRVVVLKHMFTLKELDEDPGLALELKEDVREEAETIGTVTNIHLFDVSSRKLCFVMPQLK